MIAGGGTHRFDSAKVLGFFRRKDFTRFYREEIFNRKTAHRWIWPALSALALGVAVVSIDIEPGAVALIPPSESMPHAQPADTVRAVAIAGVEATGSIRNRKLDAPSYKPVRRTPPPLLAAPYCVPSVRVATLVALRKCVRPRAFPVPLNDFDISPALHGGPSITRDDDAARLRPALSAPKPLVLRALALPAVVAARLQRRGQLTPHTIIGIASVYKPDDPADRDSGDAQTASGELYDGAAWTAAIRTDLREQFGGVGYGKAYQPAYALVETKSKSAVVKVNDVGPLAFGRVIDLNERTMRYFDPTMRFGLIRGVRVIPLPSTYWRTGPVDHDNEAFTLASAFGM